MADEDRTEAATPRRLQRAREAGQFPFSRELPTVAALGAAAALLAMAGPSLSRGLIRHAADMLDPRRAGDVAGAFAAALEAVVLAAGPIVAGIVLASLAASLAQTGMAVNPSALLPDLGRLDPRRGLGRLFGMSGLAESGKAVLKLLVMLAVCAHVGRGAFAALPPMLDAPPGLLLAWMMRWTLRLLATLLGAEVVIAGVDVVLARRRHLRQLRMSREEVRQEARETDGNPQVKRRLRQLRMARARRRMLAAVRTATVVVTNPTHYAIALSYDRMSGGAPRVVAKGVDEMAGRIRDAAAEHRVPLVANPPLARALFTVELDAEIPAEHFKVVAEIIAYVWRLQGRAAR